MTVKTAMAAGFILAASVGTAHAQDPKFEYGKQEELKDVKSVEWKAAVQAGLILTSGNSKTTTFSTGASASRKEGDNKFSLDLAAAYGKSELHIAQDLDGDMLLGADEITTVNQETTNAYMLKARYDRFLTDRNVVFVSARAGADRIAGKDLLAGAQIGYARLVLKSETQELATEIGYDFSYESYAAPDVDPLSIHSARLFASYRVKLSKLTELAAAVEWLTNLNEESDAPNDVNGDGNAANDAVGVDALNDNRVLGKLELTTKLRTNISFRFGFTARLDTAPAPLPNVKGSMGYEAGYQPIAEELDTITEATLIIDLL